MKGQTSYAKLRQRQMMGSQMSSSKTTANLKSNSNISGNKLSYTRGGPKKSKTPEKNGYAYSDIRTRKLMKNKKKA